MRISSLEVVLNGGTEQNIPFIQYKLPYSFAIVPELPSRMRYQEMNVDKVEDVVSPPYKLPRMGSGCRRRNACPPCLDNLSTQLKAG